MTWKRRSARSGRRWAPGSTPRGTWRCSPTRAVPTMTWPPTCASGGCCEQCSLGGTTPPDPPAYGGLPAPHAPRPPRALRALSVNDLRHELARASAMLDVRRFDEAAQLLARVVAAEPDRSRAWCLSARAPLGACPAAGAARAPRRLATAADAPARARALAPNEPDVHFLSGKVSLSRGDLADARRHQERALALDPAHSGAMKERGPLRLRRNGAGGAIRHFISAARATPG